MHPPPPKESSVSLKKKHTPEGTAGCARWSCTSGPASLVFFHTAVRSAEALGTESVTDQTTGICDSRTRREPKPPPSHSTLSREHRRNANCSDCGADAPPGHEGPLRPHLAACLLIFHMSSSSRDIFFCHVFQKRRPGSSPQVASPPSSPGSPTRVCFVNPLSLSLSFSFPLSFSLFLCSFCLLSVCISFCCPL